MRGFGVLSVFLLVACASPDGVAPNQPQQRGPECGHGALDTDLARNAAPWVAISNPENVDYFSARVGCQTYQPVTGMDLAALCIRR